MWARSSTVRKYALVAALCYLSSCSVPTAEASCSLGAFTQLAMDSPARKDSPPGYLVTWNVNGLLACLRRLGHAKLEDLLASFGPETAIVCLQETKMVQGQLDASLAKPAGWDAFYSFAKVQQSAGGYSGVATFCRQSVARPTHAEEGFTAGLIAPGGAGAHPLGKRSREDWHDLDDDPAWEGEEAQRGEREVAAREVAEREAERDAEQDADGAAAQGGSAKEGQAGASSADAAEAASSRWEERIEETTEDELRGLDEEGRVVVTDHGAFILINAYFPAMRVADPFATSREEKIDQGRYLFKLRFQHFVAQRIAAAKAQGRKVVLVGDLNVSHQMQDSCDPSPPSDHAKYPPRVWLNKLMERCGLSDLFRHFHPSRAAAYTCWNQQTGAKLTNYGSRIDYILVDTALLPPSPYSVLPPPPPSSFVLPPSASTLAPPAPEEQLPRAAPPGALGAAAPVGTRIQGGEGTDEAGLGAAAPLAHFTACEQDGHAGRCHP
ncbi:Endonuclease/exonuclease/phosphatase [Baffinella frigidus]|nr:Endonuclease/exonuclease/phosphatase [Cryptophyta sp. CCMP2293]